MSLNQGSNASGPGDQLIQKFRFRIIFHQLLFQDTSPHQRAARKSKRARQSGKQGKYEVECMSTTH
eukprot:2664038-Amphidinium_carterae.1